MQSCDWRLPSEKILLRDASVNSPFQEVFVKKEMKEKDNHLVQTKVVSRPNHSHKRAEWHSHKVHPRQPAGTRLRSASRVFSTVATKRCVKRFYGKKRLKCNHPLQQRGGLRHRCVSVFP